MWAALKHSKAYSTLSVIYDNAGKIVCSAYLLAKQKYFSHLRKTPYRRTTQKIIEKAEEQSHCLKVTEKVAFKSEPSLHLEWTKLH